MHLPTVSSMLFLTWVHFCPFHFTLRKHAHMIYSNFFTSKIENFQRIFFLFFLFFAQKIDCGYTLEPPRRGFTI